MRIFIFAFLLLMREIREFGYLVRYHYLWLPWFDVAFWYRCAYLWKRPHHVARIWMRENGVVIHEPDHSFTYGSTPLRTWDLIIARVGIQKGDVVYEIGSGTGLGCFFLARRLQSRVVGIEFSDSFITRAEWVRARIKEPTPFFVHADAQSIDYGEADVVYLFSTTFTPELYEGLSLRMRETLVVGALVLSVSEPMKPASSFQVIDHFDVPYFFGFCTVYVHRFLGNVGTMNQLQTKDSSFTSIMEQQLKSQEGS